MVRLALLTLCVSIAPLAAHAQTGVSDDRVSLPDGPGSIDGLGDNVSVDGNMGSMSYAVPIEVPQGFAGLVPELALSYSSSAGNTIAGIGWSMEVPCIERLTLRGLPRYTADDELAANRSEQLVRVETRGADAVYRARMERAFVRYTWHDAGSEGYFTAEYPDGRVGYFGADAEGRLVPDARLSGAEGTFRYLLVEVVDVYDHRLRYTHVKVGGVPYLASAGWVYRGGVDARYRVELGYEARPDPISDASPGFEERLTQRVSSVRVFSRAEVIRRYAITYEDAASSGGLSRIAAIERFGRDGSRYPVVHRFGYSQALGGVCEGMCERPFVVDMGTLPGAVGIRTGDATLVDIDGDALPDLVDTSQPGPHVFHRNELMGAGRARFGASYDSALGRQSELRMSLPYVQVLDVNGDGFADLVNSLSGRILCNTGSGDWSASGCIGTGDLGMALEEDADDPGDPDPNRTRFVDLNGDRRIDLMRTVGGGAAEGRLNTPGGFTPLVVEDVGREFDLDHLQLADMNGDGLLDPVVVDPDGAVRYRLSYGWGRWGEWVTAIGPRIDVSEIEEVELQDLNGDGLDDLAIVLGDTVRFGLNRNAGRFDALMTIGASDVDGALPSRSPTTTVLYADMNGNGTQDVVWVETTGQVRFLELFPVRPNLMSRVENGIGMVHEVTYGTSVEHQRTDTEAWAYRLPHAMNVVDRTDTWVTLTGSDGGDGLHEVTEYEYRDGYYDGVEKRFRGFARVAMRLIADAARDSQEAALTLSEYDVGATDVYRAGLLLRQAVLGGDEERPLSEERTVYGDCELAGVPDSGLLFDVRHVCEIEKTTIRQEGADVSAWATTRTEQRYDGYGQVVWSASHGVVHMGAPEDSAACGACERDEGVFGAACGEECLGDESYEETEYIEPGPSTGGRWILGRAHTVRRYGTPGGQASEEETYYDGADFTGLALGTLSRGSVTRTMARAGESRWIATARNALDADGNVVATLDPLGSPDDTSGHRRAYLYDAAGLRVVQTDVFLSTPEGAPYRLRQHYAYDDAFDKVIESSGWMLEGAGPTSARNSTFYRYDAFGRLSAIAKPGDTLEAPTMEVRYELADPVSRIVVSRRSRIGGEPDLEQARCLDGRGRTVQERIRIESGRWQVNGFTEFNGRGEPVRIYQPYEGTSGACDATAPSDVLYTDVHYDAANREVRRSVPDDAIYGSRSETRVVHEPLATRTYDAEDGDPESAHFDTPDVVRVDGQGRTVSIERSLRDAAGGITTAITTVVYDSLGHLRGYADAIGNDKTQDYDLLGRLLRVDDPNSGVTTFELDDGGNIVSTTDARGVTVRVEYDGANRPTRRYDEDDPSTAIHFRYDFSERCERCDNGEGQLVESTYPLPQELAAMVGDALGIDQRGFDARGRGVWEGRTLGGVDLSIEHVFDDADREIATVYPDGQRIERRYDQASRLSAIRDLVASIDYDERALPSVVTRADGTEDQRTYDPLMRLERLSSYGPSGAVLQDFGYRRERTGEILEITDGAVVPELPSAGARYRYDAWHRLIAADQDGDEQLAFAYDAIDNLESATSNLGAASRAHVGDYTYERAGVASQAGSVAFGHDAAGYLLERDDLALSWDFLGRMTEASRDGERRAQYVYGPDHNRIAVLEDGGLTIYFGRDFELRDGIGRAYARIERDRVARIQSAAIQTVVLDDQNGDGTIDAGDAYLAGGSLSILRGAARRLLHEDAPEPAQLHHDHLGSITLATREGEVTGRRRYHPYGAVRAETGWLDERGFTGQELDRATGLLHFEYRHLDPMTGRWASADPLFAQVADVERISSAIARFGYVGGRVANSVDPQGLDDPPTKSVGSPASGGSGESSRSGGSGSGSPSGGSHPTGSSSNGTAQSALSPSQWNAHVADRYKGMHNATSDPQTRTQLQRLRPISEGAAAGGPGFQALSNQAMDGISGDLAAGLNGSELVRSVVSRDALNYRNAALSGQISFGEAGRGGMRSFGYLVGAYQSGTLSPRETLSASVNGAIGLGGSLGIATLGQWAKTAHPDADPTGFGGS